MLITKPEELQKYLPSSVYEAADSLVGLTDRAERRHLVPVLGEKLYKHVCNIYEDGEMTETETKLFNLCQSAVAYFTVADNADILSLCFNQGNGLAQINTDGFTAASGEDLKRYINSAWHQAKQDVDDLCKLLEDVARALQTPQPPEGGEEGDENDNDNENDNDAAPVPEESSSDSERALIDMWRESEWFYLQGDLLLATCRDTKRYILASEEPFSYMEYVKLLGELRTRQMANIAPEIGRRLLKAIVRSQYEADVFPNVDKDTMEELLDSLRLALMAFVRWSRTDKPKYENDAKQFLFRAMEIMKLEQEKFMPHIEGSPIYVAPPADDDGQDTQDNKDNKKRMFFGSSDDSIFNPFGV